MGSDTGSSINVSHELRIRLTMGLLLVESMQEEQDRRPTLACPCRGR